MKKRKSKRQDGKPRQQVHPEPETAVVAKPPEKPESLSAHKPSVPVILSILAIIISILGLGNSLYQTTQTRKVLRLHIEPQISCIVRKTTSPQLTNSAVSHITNLPPYAAELVVFNSGKIKAVSITATCSMYVVDTNSLHVFVSMTGFDSERVHDFLLLIPELPVGQGRAKGVIGAHPMAIYVIDVEYYREADMQKFTKREFCLYDAGQYLSHAQMKSRSDYKTLMHNLQVKKLAEDVGNGTQKMPKTIPSQTKEIEGEPPPFYMFVPPDGDVRSVE